MDEQREEEIQEQPPPLEIQMEVEWRHDLAREQWLTKEVGS